MHSRYFLNNNNKNNNKFKKIGELFFMCYYFKKLQYAFYATLTH